MCSLLTTLTVNAATRPIDEKGETSLIYDEIPVRVMVDGYQTFYLDVLYTNNKLLYVNVENLFSTLNIPCAIGNEGYSLDGFIEKESQKYLIDYIKGEIKVGDKLFHAKSGLVKEKGGYYVESSLFTEAFGMALTFNYRALTILLKPNFELPLIKQQRIEKMRKSLSRIKGVESTDTIVKRDYHLFKMGTLDWSATSAQSGKGVTENRIGLGLGTEILHGEADVSAYFDNKYKFDNRQLQYFWRWVDNDRSIIKQAQVGTIMPQTISFINAPIIGGMVRNSPTTVRKATGSYTINDFTEPNWGVELFINNVLVDYTSADASGHYMFKIPNVYGYNTLKLKFYGPMGEERTEERIMNVPYTVMPVHEFEYGLSAGFLEDSTSSRFGKAEFNFGVNRMLSVGGGFEYLSSIPNSPFIPYVTATLQPFSKLTLNGEYAHGVRTRGLLDYYFNRDILLELDYAKYVDGQMATRFNAPEERKAKLSIPIRFKKIFGYAKVDFTQLVYKTFNYNQTSIMFSAYYQQLSANLSTQLNWIGQRTPFITNELALSYRLGNGYTVRPSCQYDAIRNACTNYKVAVERYLSKAMLSLSWEKNVLFHENFININYRYDLPFARTNLSVSHRKDETYTSESAQGSLAFGGGNQYIYKSNNSSMSKGGILLYPFLDLNHNGKFDRGEPMVKLKAVSIMGSKVIFSQRDSIVRIPDLNAFTNYILDLNDNDLDNISWRFKKKSYQALIDPNQFKRIDIPVVSVGEVSGTAYMNTDNTLKGIGRIRIKIYNKNNNKVVAETLSESDGYYSYMGSEPGEYVARVDTAQLSNLKLVAAPAQKDFTIGSMKEGDIVSGIDFILQARQKIARPEDKKNLAQADSLPQPSVQDSAEINPIGHIPSDSQNKVQLLALLSPLKDKGYFTKLMQKFQGLKIEETKGVDGFYHYTAGNFRSIADARKLQKEIKKAGWGESFIAIHPREQAVAMKQRPPKPLNIRMTQWQPIPPMLMAQTVKAEEDTLPSLEDQLNEAAVDSQFLALPHLAITISDLVMSIKDTVVVLPGTTLYEVHLFYNHSPVTAKEYFRQLLIVVPDLKIMETKDQKGLYHYSTGIFMDIKQAKEYLQFIRAAGWKHAYIDIYSAGSRRVITFPRAQTAQINQSG